MSHISNLKFERIPSSNCPQNCVKSIEGYILFVTGLHEETQEDDLQDEFSEFGKIRNLQMNLDRQTGYVKGYAFLEYETIKEAQAAISNMNNSQFMGKTIKVDYAFKKTPANE